MVTHRNVIIGSELVSFLISSRVCSVRADAVDLCNHLIMDEILQHEFQEHIFKDKYLFYVITPEARSNACAIGFNSDSDSDDEIYDGGARRSSLAGFGRRASGGGHSLFARNLMRQQSVRKSVTVKQHDSQDYLNDAALQDDLVAQAAADRCTAHLLFCAVSLGCRLVASFELFERSGSLTDVLQIPRRGRRFLQGGG